MNNYEYLDLLEKINKKLDPKQRAVCCRSQNTIVAAGAGSGKTQVLATRFAWLVMSCNIPASKILTLTFTKKAAGEMYERIYQTLAFFAAQEETPPKERQRAKDALEDFSNVHIQTLDSYCKHVVEQAASRYGIRPDFTVGSSDAKSDIKNQALLFVFQHSSCGAVKKFSKIGSYQSFADDLLSDTIINHASLASPQSYFSSLLAAQKKEVIAAWNFLIFGSLGNPSASENQGSISTDCSQLLKEQRLACLQDFPDASTLFNALSLFKNEFENTGNKGTPYSDCCQKALDAFSAIEKNSLAINSHFDFDSPDQQKLCLINKLCDALSLFGFPQNLRGYTNNLRKSIKPLREFYMPYLNSLKSYITNYPEIKNLQSLFDDFNNQINRQKRLSGKLTFKDVTELALEILLYEKDIRQQEKNAYDKIMIDEFQDNNSKNRDLLFLLSEKDFSAQGEGYGCKDGIPGVSDIREDKLFFVGDEKQSIYKFRGAEVSVFNELKKDLGAQNFLQMEYNYRSDNALITSFNRLFGKNDSIFSSQTEKSYEAKYDKLAIKYDPKKEEELAPEKLSLQNIRIHGCLLNKKLCEDDELLDEKNQTAFFVAKKIALMAKEAGRDGNPRKFSDFAILDKSRHRAQLLSWLNFFGIPFQQDQNNDLFSDGPINDIYAFLRLCVYPSDQNAFAVYLASPFCNLNQAALESVLAQTTLDQLPGDEAELARLSETLLLEGSQTQKERFINGVYFIKSRQKSVLAQTLAKTVSQLWYESGYHYATMENQKTELYAEQFDFLFELARKNDSDGKKLSWFVDQLATVKNKEKNFSDDTEIDVSGVSYPLEAPDAVQIMTIHKSKGLQFKYVFVLGCIDARSKSDNSQIFFDKEFGATLSAESGGENYFSIIQKKLSRAKELAEFRRLIYVAITRAISDVYIVGAWSGKASSDSSAADEESLKLLEKTIEFYYPEAADGNFALGEETLSKNESVPFSYYSIPPMSKSEAYNTPVEDGLYGRTRIFDPLPGDLQSLPYEKPESNRKTPSSLEQDFDFKSEDFQNDLKYDSSSDLLEKSAFTAADFGTLVHDYLRAQAEGIHPEQYQPPVKLFKQLSQAEIKKNKDLCARMCGDFAGSDLGRAAYAAEGSAKSCKRLLKAEWAFRMWHENAIWTGSIDLIYENEDGTFTIVDYKSDESIAPKKYEGQQKCYRIAASKLLKIPEDKISCRLWYLRFNKEVLLF